MTIHGLGQKNGFEALAEPYSPPAPRPETTLEQAYDIANRSGHSEAIDSRNDPTRFGLPQLETRIERLAMSGKAKQRPWADTYWPTYQDAVNHRWQQSGDFLNDLSPAEKYDRAFNNWNPESVRGLKPFKAEWGSFDKPFDQSYYDKLGPFAKYVSNNAGNKKVRDASVAGLLKSDGTAKSGNKREDFGGIEPWWGLCHAWCPASILEKEPQKAVIHNGVKFEVSDIKALLIAAYARPDSRLIGGRSEDRPDAIDLDANGRPTKSDFRDINPGTFHILLGTMLGRDGVAFIEDRTAHYEVWNQPIAEYKVQQMQEITEAQAAALVRDTDAEYDYNPNATRFFHVKTEVDYITESHPSTRPNSGTDAQERTDPYEYILECDREGNIVGGEWLGSSRNDHPDFLWNPKGSAGTLGGGLTLEKVREIAKKSVEGGGGGTPDGVKVEQAALLTQGQTKELPPITVQRDGVLEFALTGSGDMDVYVKKGRAPTFNASGQPQDTDMFMYEPGSQERKTLNVKAGDVVYVTMRGYEARNDATLRINQL
jgi:hypothetical protein